MKKILILTLLLMVGCAMKSPYYIEGTVFEAGLYLPYEGTLYGCEICSYVNGCKVSVCTNYCYEISRQHSSTNSYFFGMFETKDSSETKVKILEKK